MVNREFCRVFALEEAQIIGKSDRELFSSEIADALATNDRLVMETKKPLTAEERLYHGDGTLHTYLSFKFPFFNQQQQVVSIIGIATNVTQEKQIKTALKKTTAKFRNTFELAAVGIAHVALNGKWLKVNQKLCQIVGYSKKELLKLFKTLLIQRIWITIWSICDKCCWGKLTLSQWNNATFAEIAVSFGLTLRYL